MATLDHRVKTFTFLCFVANTALRFPGGASQDALSALRLFDGWPVLRLKFPRDVPETKSVSVTECRSGCLHLAEGSAGSEREGIGTRSCLEVSLEKGQL